MFPMFDPASSPTADPTMPASLATGLRIVFGKLKRRLREQVTPGDLNWSQISVLGRLEREGSTTVTALARAEGMRTQSMGPHIAALEAAGLIRGAPDPHDGRQTILSLTDAFHDWVAKHRAAREDWLASVITAKFSPTEREVLARAVVLLDRLAEP